MEVEKQIKKRQLHIRFKQQNNIGTLISGCVGLICMARARVNGC